MKFGLRTPSLKKRIAARTSWKRMVRHSLGLKAPRGWGWLTNPRKAAYNRVYNRTTVSVDRLLKAGGRRRSSSSGRRRSSSGVGVGGVALVVAVVVAAFMGIYMVVAAMVALVVWLFAVATRRAVARQAQASLTVSETPASQPPPEIAFRELVLVDPTAFDDHTLAEAAAAQVFAAWAAQLPKEVICRTPDGSLQCQLG